ncbi:carbohydrate sulfotransferase 9-like [Malaclemys terrapin pileata]|uniref:carbohydrate sulfotransferase 9-like n=1 Tax=Malaclemys terrapin pileata TaxID=2991368 RepID=UPI0023A81511|nr:carbohydrate sulfotransferase 9-like [Malaclemys terrapin pileata]
MKQKREMSCPDRIVCIGRETLHGPDIQRGRQIPCKRPHPSPSWENMVDKVFQKVFIFLVLTLILGSLLSGVFYKWQTKMMIPKEDWLMSQVYRRDTLNSTCLMNNLSHSQSKLKHDVATRIFVEHNHKFIYCEVPKVGCSNWKKIILLLTLNLSRKANEVDHDLIHQTSLIKRLSSYPSDYQEKLLTSYTKVMFTRDPLERLVSAYRDKLLHSEPYYSITVANEIKATCRKNENSTEKVTFQEFVNFILTKKQEHLDIHWKPMFLLCDPCNIHYDIMGKFETLEQDSEHVLRNIGAPEDMHYPNFKKYGSEKRTSDDITLEYLGKLSSEKIEKIKKLYQMDFALFNYPYDLKMNLYETDTV